MKFNVLSMADISFIRDEFSILHEIADVDHHVPDEAALEQLIPRYDAYLCSLKIRMDRKVLDAARKLQVIVTPSTGLDHIDIAYAEEKGIKVISLRNDLEVLNQITATAELHWGLLLGVVRNIPWAFAAAKEGVWARDRFRGMQLSNKKLGIIGYGRLGKMVAEYGRSFRMEVMACDLKPFQSSFVRQVDMNTLLMEADVISIHIHLYIRQ